jgi:hypothetical protein
VHEASAFLSIVLNIWSPQSALDIDNDTSCHPETESFYINLCVLSKYFDKGRTVEGLTNSSTTLKAQYIVDENVALCQLGNNYRHFERLHSLHI